MPRVSPSFFNLVCSLSHSRALFLSLYKISSLSLSLPFTSSLSLSLHYRPPSPHHQHQLLHHLKAAAYEVQHPRAGPELLQPAVGSSASTSSVRCHSRTRSQLRFPLFATQLRAVAVSTSASATLRRAAKPPRAPTKPQPVPSSPPCPPTNTTRPPLSFATLLRPTRRSPTASDECSHHHLLGLAVVTPRAHRQPALPSHATCSMICQRRSSCRIAHQQPPSNLVEPSMMTTTVVVVPCNSVVQIRCSLSDHRTTSASAPPLVIRPHGLVGKILLAQI